MENVIDKELKMLRACKTEEDREKLVQRLKEEHQNDSPEVNLNNLRDIKSKIAELSVEVQLLELQNHGISLTHLANYIGKSRAYLSQRLHGHSVNGKQYSLTRNELEKIATGLKETGTKLQELSASLLSV